MIMISFVDQLTNMYIIECVQLLNATHMIMASVYGTSIIGSSTTKRKPSGIINAKNAMQSFMHLLQGDATMCHSEIYAVHLAFNYA